jgi:hypothetical protein
LKSRSSDPISIPVEEAEEEAEEEAAESWFRMTDRTACVPHAFWIVWAAKNRPFSVASGSYVPSCGVDASLDWPPIHLKRKITPYTGLRGKIYISSPSQLVTFENAMQRRTYLKERIVSASRETSSSNCTSLTPRFSIREVNTPYPHHEIPE